MLAADETTPVAAQAEAPFDRRDRPAGPDRDKQPRTRAGQVDAGGGPAFEAEPAPAPTALKDHGAHLAALRTRRL